MSLSNMKEFADTHGYMSCTCTIHGRFHNDSGIECPVCEDLTDEYLDMEEENEAL